MDSFSSTLLLQGFISSLFNSAFPYPGNDFIIISYCFNILLVSFGDISFNLFLLSLLVIHQYTIFSTRLVFFFDELPL